MPELELVAGPMSREKILDHLFRFHGFCNPEILKAYLDEVPLYSSALQTPREV